MSIENYNRFKAYCRKHKLRIGYYDQIKWGTAVSGIFPNWFVIVKASETERDQLWERVRKAHRLARLLCDGFIKPEHTSDIHYHFHWREKPAPAHRRREVMMDK